MLVYYQYDKEKGTLSFKQVTDYDADNKSQDWITKGESGIDVLSGLMSLGSWTVLAENIVNFPVPTCQYLSGNEYNTTNSDNIPIPQRVILSMTLIDSDTRKKLTPILTSYKKDFKDVYDIAIKKEEDLENVEKPIADLAKQSLQTFVQAVSIDR